MHTRSDWPLAWTAGPQSNVDLEFLIIIIPASNEMEN